MAADYTSLIMKDGAKLWNAKPPKPPKEDKRPEKRRNGVLAKLDETVKALDADKATPRGWTFERGDMVLATLRTGTREIRFPGGEEIQIRKGKKVWGAIVPKERAADFYKAIRPIVAEGKLDKEIAAAWEGGAATKSRAPRGAQSQDHRDKISAARRGFKGSDGKADLAAYRKWVSEGSDPAKLPKKG